MAFVVTAALVMEVHVGRGEFHRPARYLSATFVEFVDYITWAYHVVTVIRRVAFLMDYTVIRFYDLGASPQNTERGHQYQIQSFHLIFLCFLLLFLFFFLFLFQFIELYIAVHRFHRIHLIRGKNAVDTLYFASVEVFP